LAYVTQAEQNVIPECICQESGYATGPDSRWSISSRKRDRNDRRDKKQCCSSKNRSWPCVPLAIDIYLTLLIEILAMKSYFSNENSAAACLKRQDKAWQTVFFLSRLMLATPDGIFILGGGRSSSAI
jgi:hypothetical protein